MDKFLVQQTVLLLLNNLKEQSAAIDFGSPTEKSSEMVKIELCSEHYFDFKIFQIYSDQIERIQNLNLFKIICLANSCNGTRVQADPFLSPGPTNMKKVCPPSDQILGELNLGKW